jgi:putative ATP-dependent endonuclease of OLD family
MPLDVMPALRDAESDLFNWRYSPLRPLLDDSSSRISPDLLSSIASKISAANNGITEVVEIKSLAERITTKLEELVGSYQAFETKLGFTPADTEKLIRSLRLFIDNGKRGINEASLGSTNLLYIALRILELEQLVDQNKRNHTFLAIEEPEAHLHPHLQRLVFQKLLRSRTNQSEEPDECEHSKFTTLILTTHSPHIVSVSPIRSLIALRKTVEGNATEGVSTSNLELSENDIVDLERYIDVSRGEIVFARGILLVEGESELYILPAICKLLGKNLDELGITVCSVHGTNFAPYIKFLGSKGLDKPFAVLTDNDPQTGKISIGIQRLISLLPLFEPIEDLTNISTDEVKRLGKAHGLFLNDHTLEVDLFKCGQHKSICKTIIELSDNGAAKKRATVWNDKPDELDIDRFLKDIEEIGKGRFAQRFSSNISGVSYPNYILDAIDYVSNKCR